MAPTTLPEAAATVQLDAALFPALLQAAARAKACYPAERLTIERGVSLVLAGHVTLHTDGTATVQSASAPGTVYHVNGRCTCPNEPYAPEGRCKHRWAKSLLRACLKDQGERWYATYYGPDEQPQWGTTTYIPGRGWLFVPEDGADPFFASAEAIARGGQVSILEAQRQADGDLVARVCGYAAHGRA